MMDGQHGVVVTLPEIYAKVLQTDEKVDKLSTSVGEMVAVNKRLDQHHDRLNDHGSRIGTLETAHAIAASRPRAPWWVTISAVAAILTSVAALFGLIVIIGKVSAALG